MVRLDDSDGEGMGVMECDGDIGLMLGEKDDVVEGEKTTGDEMGDRGARDGRKLEKLIGEEGD